MKFESESESNYSKSLSNQFKQTMTSFLRNTKKNKVIPCHWLSRVKQIYNRNCFSWKIGHQTFIKLYFLQMEIIHMNLTPNNNKRKKDILHTIKIKTNILWTIYSTVQFIFQKLLFYPFLGKLLHPSIHTKKKALK